MNDIILHKPEEESKAAIKNKFDSIRDMVLEKNELYGNAALEPYAVFSNATPAERLRARIDEKISRYRTNKEGDKESPLVDLVGSLVLLILAEEEEENEQRCSFESLSNRAERTAEKPQ